MSGPDASKQPLRLTRPHGYPPVVVRLPVPPWGPPWRAGEGVRPMDARTSWRGRLASEGGAIGWERLLRPPLPRHPLRLRDLGGCHHLGQDVAFLDGKVTHVFFIS